MTEKPNYRKLNPKVANLINGEPDPLGVEFHIYQEDGSSNPITLPNGDELFETAKLVLAAFPNKDARFIYNVLTEMVDMVGGLIPQMLSGHHHFVHAHTPEGYDEDILCEGIRKYLDNVHEAAENVVTPETSEKYVLETFFTGDKKPN